MRAMRRPRFNGSYLMVTAVMVAVIIYGSLYPFEFRIPLHGPGPLRMLLGSWANRPGRGDFVSNILLYMPLGFFSVLAAGSGASAWWRLVRAVLIGAVLCVGIELIQYYDVGRQTSASDVYSNVLGSAVGALAGIVIGGDIRWAPLRAMAAERFAALLLAAWIGYRLYPYVPTIDLHKYWNALKPVVLHPNLAAYDLFRHTAVWLTIAVLIEALGPRRRSWLLFPLFAAAVLFAKVLIISTVLSPAEVAGAGVAFLAWLCMSFSPRLRIVAVTTLLIAYVVAMRLEPFQFAADARQFGWVPFQSLTRGSIGIDVMSFLEKFFLYGSLIWLFGKAGARLLPATLFVAGLLLATAWAERYLPHRSAEITDAVMALIIAGIIAVMRPGAATAAAPSSSGAGSPPPALWRPADSRPKRP